LRVGNNSKFIELFLNKLWKKGVDIFSFDKEFTDEVSFRVHFKEQGDQEGVICNRCGGSQHYWL
jgi:uncharacterized protein with ParB-like and HNH nuclease domain